MIPFEKCTRRGKLRRLRRLAAAALQQYDLEIDRLDLLATDTNILYRVTDRHGQQFALRLADPRWRDREAAVSETLWLDALAADTDIPVPRIRRSRDGAAVISPQAEGAPADWHALLMNWQPGMLLGKRLTARNLTAMGRMFARLHAHGRSWQPPSSFSPRQFTRYISRGEPQVLFTDENLARYSAETAQQLTELHETVSAAYAALDSADLQVIHCDLWHDNINIFRGELYPFDFEDTILGHRLHDIGMAMLDLYEVLDEEQYRTLLTAFRAGYTELLPWPEGELALFQLGRKLWVLNYIGMHWPQHLPAAADFYIALYNRYRQTGRLVPPLAPG